MFLKNRAHNEIQISMRTWRSFLRAASQVAFVVIPEISLRDISCIHKIMKGTNHGPEKRIRIKETC